MVSALEKHFSTELQTPKYKDNLEFTKKSKYTVGNGCGK